MTPKVLSLHIYPIKSCQGISVEQMRVSSRGPVGDREWCIVDKNGKFLTQRQTPQLAQVKVELTESSLSLGLNEEDFIHLPLVPEEELQKISIWDEPCEGQVVTKLASEWFSNFLGFQCHLVKMTELI